jgi:hypothetical protein
MEKIPTDPVISNPDTWAKQVEADIADTQREIDARKRAASDKAALNQLLTRFVLANGGPRLIPSARPKSINRQ